MVNVSYNNKVRWRVFVIVILFLVFLDYSVVGVWIFVWCIENVFICFIEWFWLYGNKKGLKSLRNIIVFFILKGYGMIIYLRWM